MKNLMARMLTLLSLAVLLLAGIARAQYVPVSIQVKVPFEFTANEKEFPAGEYSIVRTGPDRLEIRDMHGHRLASLVTHSVQSLYESTSTKLRFSTEGRGHVLKQVWIDERIGNEFAAAKPHTAVAKRNMRKPVEVGGGSR